LNYGSVSCWSCRGLLGQTGAAMMVSILPQWEDIDELDDLRRFADDREPAGSAVHTLKCIELNREKIFRET